MPVRPPVRLLRASVFAAVCVALTLTGHGTASGIGVPAVAAAAGWAGALAVAWVLSGHERSLSTILGGLLGGQFGLHALFSAAQAEQEFHPAAHGGQAAEAATGPGMTSAHLAAAVVAAWWLRRGERLAWSLARQLGAFALAGIPVLLEPVPTPIRRTPPLAQAPVRPRGTQIRHSVGLRGPPSRSVPVTI
ncbi:hypothetical protein [Thermomonospora cellulosilytica]|uniref:Uncharacterized protein n=1 Tax=Thermomonospora cellulosilytica TaxID=1411118 RepID=A0A7W3N049_9ACTN|nr:hypothetical protein [Thermomonospora cellulosilytica]MBA9005059.1 hypothetical protein [Thermomonospora cellulosilytica]